VQIDTATPEDSIVLIYDGLRRLVDLATAALAARNYYEVSQNVGKAQRVLSELSLALNHDAGEIAANLEKLYEYWGWRLGEGLIHKEAGAFSEVSAALGEFREAWAGAARQTRAQRALRANA
jgi:flagellar protein FliS